MIIDDSVGIVGNGNQGIISLMGHSLMLIKIFQTRSLGIIARR
jgi:hypothetical protein